MTGNSESGIGTRSPRGVAPLKPDSSARQVVSLYSIGDTIFKLVRATAAVVVEPSGQRGDQFVGRANVGGINVVALEVLRERLDHPVALRRIRTHRADHEAQRLGLVGRLVRRVDRPLSESHSMAWG